MLIVFSIFENNILDVFELKESRKPDIPYVMDCIYPNNHGISNYPVGNNLLKKLTKEAIFVHKEIEQRLFLI